MDHGNWAGEGQYLLFDSGYQEYFKNRWKSEYNLDFDRVKRMWDKYWDYSKTVLCDKSPSTLCRADKFEKYFSQFGEVRFVILIRSPYSYGLSADDWIKYSKMIKRNMEVLSTYVIVKYEDLIFDIEKVKEQILRIVPELTSLDVSMPEAKGLSTERNKEVNPDYATRVIKAKEKTKRFVDSNNVPLPFLFSLHLLLFLVFLFLETFFLLLFVDC